MSRKNRSQRRKRRKEQSLEVDPYEGIIEAIMRRERTTHATEEGYHFVRPSWHRIVYGGGKQKP